MVTTRVFTADELMAMGSNVPFELIEGELIRVSPSSGNPSVVAGRIHGWLFVFVTPNDLGTLTIGDGGYLLETAPDTVLAPDVAFTLHARMPHIPKRGYFTVRPDLIVEVISPTDEREDMRRKQATYDRVGVPIVWWIDPIRETAAVHVQGQPVTYLDRDGILDGGEILPGFTLHLAKVL